MINVETTPCTRCSQKGNELKSIGFMESSNTRINLLLSTLAKMKIKRLLNHVTKHEINV